MPPPGKDALTILLAISQSWALKANDPMLRCPDDSEHIYAAVAHVLFPPGSPRNLRRIGVMGRIMAHTRPQGPLARLPDPEPMHESNASSEPAKLALSILWMGLAKPCNGLPQRKLTFSERDALVMAVMGAYCRSALRGGNAKHESA